MRNCWAHSPAERPSFLEIIHQLEAMIPALAPSLHVALTTAYGMMQLFLVAICRF